MRRFLTFAFAVLWLAACTPWSDGAPSVVETDDPFPRLSGEALAGGTIDTADIAGRVLVVNVWATWCGPCRREQPALVRLANRYEEDGVAFLGINHTDDRAKARDWVREFDVPYPSLFDPEGRFSADLGYAYLPDTYVVDASRTIRWTVFGETDEQELAGLIDEVLETNAD